MEKHPTKPIPYTLIKDYVLEASNDTNMIVSVGSGTGIIEKYIEDRIDKNILCIDPNPESSVGMKYHGDTMKKIVKGPDYSCLHDFQKKNPNIEKITLILIWTLPTDPFESIFESKESNDYDIEAIYKLNPENIVLLYDVTGISGSWYFHRQNIK